MLHLSLTYFVLQILNEIGSALSAILVEPVLKHVKTVIKDACQRLERDIPRFQEQVEGRGAEEKMIYRQVFIIVTGENAGT